MINLVSMQIIIVFSNCLGEVIYVIKIFCFKFFKIHLNTIPKMVVLSVQGCILIESIYNKFVDQVMVNYLNIKFLSKENF